MPKKTKTRAVGYVRVSTEEQAQEGLSLSNQEERIRAYCFSKGWDLRKSYRDEGVSGKDLKRDGIQGLLGDLGSGDIDVVVTYKLDRVTRQMRDLWSVLDRFETSGVSFVSVLDNFDTTTANGRLILNILGSHSPMGKGYGLREDERRSQVQDSEWGVHWSSSAWV